VKILVAMSGGVDSSVAAYMLRQAGHDVAGITMNLGYDNPDGSHIIIGGRAADDAAKVCSALSIPHHVIDLSDQFQQLVIDDFVTEYGSGRTPNPCVRCNRYLKFGALIDETLRLGYEKLATGHYANKGILNANEVIRKNRDERKDQSYFLWGVERSALSRILFPLNDFTKHEIRTMAIDAKLPSAYTGESQDICFIAEDYRHFILPRISNAQPGDFVNRTGKVLGRHNGIPHYTIGQRKGLGISAPAPLYVISFNEMRNEVILGYRDEISSSGCMADQINLFVDTLPEELTAKIRYAHRQVPCSASISGDSMKVLFETPQDAVTPGQSVVLYHQDMVVGGGIITESIG
jgi:tRNA-specific 2-thiouridylase